MPFAAKLLKDNYWPVYASYSIEPIRLILELIWTRLSYKYGLSSIIFGEDLEIELLHDYIRCKQIIKDGSEGWEYRYNDTPKNILENTTLKKEWEPAFLNETQIVVISRLCIDEEIEISDPDFQQYIISSGYNLEIFIDNLIETGLVCIDKQNKLRLLTKECGLLVLPDGRFAAGENCSGRLNRWSLKLLERDKKLKYHK